MPSFRRALFFSFAGKYSTLIIDFVSVMIISRIFTPAEIGVYSLAAASIVIGQMLRDFGLSLYIIQEKELTTPKIQGCFTISLILCWVISLGYFISAPYIGDYFNSPKTADLVQILAINFLLIPFGTFTLSLLKREMLFDKIMKIDVTSTILRVGALLIMAFQGAGIISLAVASVIGTGVTVLMTFPHTDWKHYRFNFKNIKQIASYSTTVSATNILEELKNVISEMSIAKAISVEAVAFYSKAVSTAGIFSKLILQFMIPVIQPYMAKLKRDNNPVDQTTLKIFSYLQVISFPFYAFVYFFSDEVIFHLYGDQWGAVPELLEVICITMYIVYITPIAEQFLNVLGHEKQTLRLTFGLIGLRVLMLVVFFTYKLDMLALLYLFLSISLVRLLFVAPMLKRFLAVPYYQLFGTATKNLGIAAALFVGFHIETRWLNLNPIGYLDLLFIILCSFTIWFLLVLLFKHPILEELRQTLPPKISRFIPGTKGKYN